MRFSWKRTHIPSYKLFSSEEESEFLYIKDFSLFLNRDGEKKKALHNINLTFSRNKVWGIVGPSGAGKSLLLNSISKGILEKENSSQYSWEGQIVYRGTEIFSNSFPIELLKKKIGLISQLPVLFPLTIRENILFALKARGLYDSKLLELKLKKILIECDLWEELKDRLDSCPIGTLSVGQAQKLCFARALILDPELLLMDEPTSALDPSSASKIEKLILKIAHKITVIIVSHSLSQVKHIADYTIFLKGGRIIEYGPTPKMFTSPQTKEFKNFILGQY
ncbi:phosphate import ATP-binding protein PstB [Mycoplasma wenyonii str. Massachusetts]|uniref:Phosphate import ATP-binding protein PstB n=1 Tax=Mycoplasma wenyonii (strain Massachusetts) TaxID=1197325 RepID=I6Z6H8_MYCWM|nr:ATP-binding cassette domain-containing protein [Mycoplasma wenyonii]AFN65198.1 phosphate import ATP-binding protein PstB [Mycoplasma wenyonii str. Massachusetts]